jgi:uncharacterized protein with LGFP repeats
MKAVPAATGAMRHVGGVAAQALLIAAIVALLALVLSPLYAPAKTITGAADVNAGRNGGSSIVVVGSDTARVASVYGGDVTTFSTLAKDFYLVYVRVTCTQDGARVFEAWENIKTGTWDTDGYATFTMAGSSWGGGGAMCSADLLSAVMKGGRRVYNELATTSFFVGG